ncbi:MAG TPA: DNA polymerase I [Terriglobales bacterium]|nr:DNA polymerase I [Terriglobales bacterium]
MATKPARVFLIDTYGFIFRAYHAMIRQRPMSTRTGIPTAATYVFVNMLNKLREEFQPEYLAAIMEAGPSFRDEKARELTSVRKFDIKTQQFKEIDYHGYKANRTEMPADLRQQVPYIERALEAYRIPMIEQENYEADDVIGTLAHKAAAAGHEVFIVSADKDMYQLVADRVCILNPQKDNLICDAAKVEEILGVPPRQVIDVMALRGDSIDNVPGAPGIGDKGSVEIIKRFGSLDAALEHANEVEKKTYRESLLNNRDVIELSKELVTIKTDIDIPLDLEGMKAQSPDPDLARKLFAELEFTTLLKSVLPGAEEDLKSAEYTELKSAADLKKFLQGAEGPLAVAFDTPQAQPVATEETNGEEAPAAPTSGDLFAAPPAAPTCSRRIALSTESGKAATAELAGELGDELKKLFADPATPKAVHDLKTALRNCAALELELAGVTHETALYSYLLEPTTANHALSAVVLRRLNTQLSDSLAQAADFTGRLARMLRKEVEELELVRAYNEIDLPLISVVLRMEEHGIAIDLGALHELAKRLGTQSAEVANKIYELAGEKFNIGSPKQLGVVLFEKMKLPIPVKYGKGKKISTAQDVLDELAPDHEVVRHVLEYRQLTKLKSTYIDTLPQLIDPQTGRVHTTFNQTGTATGRLSSNNPNLQNIPIRTELGREIRAAFVAQDGNLLLAADYSQIELRLLAHYSEDPLLTKAFREGHDIHQLTASEVFGIPKDEIDAEHRRRAKAVNFGIVYGLSPFGLAQQLGIEQKEAKKYIEGYFEKYAGVRTYIDRVVEATRRDGFVRTEFGRRRPIPDINSKNPSMRGFAERTAVNTPLQGTAADLIKLAMINIDRELTKRKLKSRMLLQVHDELVFEVPPAEINAMRTLVQDAMENVHPLRVPLLVDVGVGNNWRDMD